MHERAGKARDDDEHGIAEDVSVQHLALAAALGTGGEHVLLADLVEKRVLGQHRHESEGGETQSDDRKRQVPKIIEGLLPPRQCRPVLGRQPAQRKPGKERAAGEQDDQQNCEQKTGNRIADDDHARGPHVERRAVGHRLTNPERDRDRVGQQQQPDAERDRHRQLLLDQLQHAHVAEIALAEIEPQIVPQHQREAFMRRLVEAELLFQLCDKSGVEALRAAILRRHGFDLRAGLASTRPEVAAGRAAGARACPGIGT